MDQHDHLRCACDEVRKAITNWPRPQHLVERTPTGAQMSVDAVCAPFAAADLVIVKDAAAHFEDGEAFDQWMRKNVAPIGKSRIEEHVMLSAFCVGSAQRERRVASPCTKAIDISGARNLPYSRDKTLLSICWRF